MSPLSRCLLFLLALYVAPLGYAQGAFTVRGAVLDPTGAGIAGAVVQLQTTAGAPVHQTRADSHGAFTFSNLPAGAYSLVAPAFNGFAPRTVPLRITGDLTNVKLTLHLDTVHQEVTVGADPTLSVDPADNRDTITSTGDQLRKLPVFDQDFIAALRPFLDASSGSSGGATIIVDGVEMKSAGVSASAIQEVRVNNDPYSAEFTRPGRGRIEIITKPGTPIFHGEANFLFLDSIFNAKSYPAIVKPPKVRTISEGHLSGPVGHGGHTSFIASGSFRQRHVGVVVDAVGINGPIVENVLAPTLDAQATLRVTHDFSASHRLSLGYNYEGSYNTNGNVGGLTLPEAGTKQQSREDDAILNDRIIVSPTLINQLQITFEKDEDVTASATKPGATTPICGEAQPNPNYSLYSVQISGSITCGGAQADVARTENTIHVNEVLTWSHGRHYIRAGVQLPQFSRRAVSRAQPLMSGNRIIVRRDSPTSWRKNTVASTRSDRSAVPLRTQTTSSRRRRRRSMAYWPVRR